MEEELKCPNCQQFATDPILLDCGHSYCRQCAVTSQQGPCQQSPATSHSTVPPTLLAHIHSSTPLSPPSSSSAASDTISLCVSEQDQESDKLSVVSETDSGVVVCGRNSRPASLIGGASYLSTTLYHRLPPILTPSTSGCSICCKSCHKPTYYPDEQTVLSLPSNTALVNVINRQLPEITVCIDARSDFKELSLIFSQLCDGDKPEEASVFCEQCDIYYCSACQSSLHPARGPLASHKLVPPSARKRARTPIGALKDCRCMNHPSELLSMYCTICRTAVCCVCLQEIRHTNHDVQSLEKTCKSQKVKLSNLPVYFSILTSPYAQMQKKVEFLALHFMYWSVALYSARNGEKQRR
ncbi:unnamed protein product [Enterobius vermicularis]|uniref:B box-type domain-containing protein n=1 Tax=Enterobius vermicularis TaxID=51028 RepID=A0A0N4UYI1_ENTVE|nr:unnamed protein product [Enterobius vermicularis]